MFHRRGLRFMLAFGFMALLSGGAFSGAGVACPFCVPMERMVDKVRKAPVVLYGSLSNPRRNLDPQPGEPNGTTDMKVVKRIKSHPLADKKTELKLSRYIPTAEETKTNWIVFADIIDDQIQPFLAMPNDPEGVYDYLQGALDRQDKPPVDRLAYAFKYFDHAIDEVSMDAYLEFAQAPYADVVAAKKAYDPEKIMKWLSDKNTKTYLVGLLGLMVGVCGRPQDAPVLKQFIDDPEKRPIVGVDGVMAGYCLIDLKKGSEHVMGIITDKNQDFNLRYSAKRALDFLLTDVVGFDKKWALGELAKSIAFDDFADIAIDELRKQQSWQYLDRVLKTYDDPKSKDNPLIRRAAICFALKAPGDAAKAFIEKVR